MQKGFATLEIILAALIIALLMSTTIPNAVRLVDKVSLDYETKRLYSELRLIESMNKSEHCKGTGTGLGNVGDETYIKFIGEPSSYQVINGSGLGEKIFREPHVLSYGVKISSPKSKMNFETEKIVSNHITLTSRLGKKNKIVFDSVGRMRGDNQ